MATEVGIGGYTPPKPASPAVEAITTLVSQVLTSSAFWYYELYYVIVAL